MTMKRIQTELSGFKMNMQMFVDEFMSRGYEPYFYCSQYDRMKLDKVMLYYGQDNLDEHILYVCAEGMYRKDPVTNEDICFIICGTSVPKDLDFRQPVLYFYKEDAAFILNMALEILYKMFDYVNQMQMALQFGGLNSLANIGVELFNNPLTIHDEKFFVLSRPRNILGMSEILQDTTTGIATFRIEMINILKNDPDYIKTLTTRGSHLWIYHSITPYRVMYVNLFDNNQRYRGRILLNEINSIFYPSQFQLLEYFAEYVLLALKDYRRDTGNSNMVFDSFLQKYLNGEYPSRDTALKVLSYNFWQQKDSYCSACIDLQETVSNMSSQDIAMAELSMAFPQARIFQHDSLIWMVINLKQSSFSEDDFKEKMADFARSCPCLVGQSSVFHDFFRLPAAYKQAEMALEYAHTVQDTRNLYIFDEIAVSYAIMKLRTQISEDAYCCEELFRLIENDEKKGTEYYKTLQIYLEHERDLSRVSSLLHIHRSTLTYRITKIEELLRLPLDDSVTRFYLLCCFRVLNNKY